MFRGSRPDSNCTTPKREPRYVDTRDFVSLHSRLCQGKTQYLRDLFAEKGRVPRPYCRRCLMGGKWVRRSPSLMDFWVDGQKMLASLMRRNRARDLRKRKFTMPTRPSFRCLAVGVVHYVHRLLMRGHSIPPIHSPYFFMTGRIVMFRTRKTVTDLFAKSVLLKGTPKGSGAVIPSLPVV